VERFTVRMPQEERPRPASAGVVGLAVVALLAAGPGWFFGMSTRWNALFVVACVATRAAKNHRRLQQTLRVAAATLFLSFAEVTFLVAFPAVDRIVCFGAIVGTAVVFYESGVKH
jgi:hypothetical protein